MLKYILMLLSMYACLFPITGKARTDKMAYSISIPKSGTHLMFKLLEKLGLTPFELPVKQGTVADRLEELHINYFNPNTYVYFDPELVHLVFNKNHERYIHDSRFAYFFVIRDPRDQMVSLIYHMKARPEEYPTIQNMPFNDILMGIIDPSTHGPLNNKEPLNEYEKLLAIGGTISWYRDFINWMRNPHICTVKFEDLIGVSGGGSQELQHSTVARIADHLGLVITQEEIKKIIAELFGGTGTFREGKIGSWKTHFSSEHKATFKKNALACEILIKLGYEQDYNW